MELFQTFHWWYIPLGFVLVVVFFGKTRGGTVATRLVANLQVLDPRFEQCRTEAEYTTFVNGSADHIEIDIERLPLAIDDELELFLNGRIFSTIAVRRDKEAEFDNWDDETLDVPPIKAGDELVIKYENRAILQGVFELLA